MNASKLFTAVAALVFAGSAVAADVPVATVASSAAVAAAAQSAANAQPARISREQVRAEAVEAVKHRRATEAGQADWFMK